MPSTEKPLTWFITGCSSGFGLPLARLVQTNGHNLIATSRNPSNTPYLVQEVESKEGKWLQLNVNDLNCAEVIDKLESSGQAIDVLVNNAGYSIFAPVETFAEDDVAPAVPRMRERRSGLIVNISSGAALEGRKSMGGYAPAKAALDVLSKEVAPFNVRVLTVWLGTFNTNTPNAALYSKNPVPKDYDGTPADRLLKAIGSKAFSSGGDKEKAMRAVYDVVMGEGVGAGHESERFLPLGRDMVVRVGEVQAQYVRTMEVFGDVCNNVYRV